MAVARMAPDLKAVPTADEHDHDQEHMKIEGEQAEEEKETPKPNVDDHPEVKKKTQGKPKSLPAIQYYFSSSARAAFRLNYLLFTHRLAALSGDTTSTKSLLTTGLELISGPFRFVYTWVYDKIKPSGQYPSFISTSPLL